MKILMHLAAMVLALILASTALAQDAAPQPAPSQDEAINELITVLENDELRAQFLTQLRAMAAPSEEDTGTAPVAGTTPPATSAEPAADAEAAAGASEEPAPQPGLVDALSGWSSDLLGRLPTTTFGVPIDQKAQQAGAQVTSRLQAGVGDGQLLRFAVWALPGLLLVIATSIIARWLGHRLTAPSVPVHKGRLIAGLLIKLVGAPVLYVLLATVLSYFAPSELASRVFLTLTVGTVLAMLLTDLAISALSALTGLRGLRLVSYCQKRFYRWFVAISHAALFAGLSNDPVLRRVIGWSAADLAGFALNILAACLVLAFTFRHKRAIGRLIFGGASREAPSDNPLRNATRRLAKRWHLLAYAFLILSVVSVVAGQRNNDILGQMLWSFGAVLVGLVAAPLLHRLFTLRAPAYKRPRLTARQVIISSLFKALRLVGDVVVVFAVSVVITRIWGFDFWGWVIHDGQTITGPMLAAATCIAIAWLIWVILDAWIASALTPSDGPVWARQRSSRVQTLLPLIRNGVMILLIVLAGIAALANLGVDVTPLIAGAGVFGLALSFGSQQLVQDVITGIFILAEDTIAIGDTINTGDRSGVVESISLRTIRLRDGDGALHSIPFSTVKALKNSSRNFGVMRPRYTVPSSVDPEQVMEAMREAAKALREDPRYSASVKSDMLDLGIDEINAGSVVVSGSLRTTPSRQIELGRAFNGRLLAGLAEKGITI